MNPDSYQIIDIRDETEIGHGAIPGAVAVATEEIEGNEMGVKALTGGLTSEDLVVKKVEDTGKVDKEGRPIKVTKYEPKTGTVVFNEEANVYEIHTEEPEVEDVAPETVDDTEMAPETEVKAGEESPFDPTNTFNNGAEASDKLPLGE